jgi:predicted flap endonuclease-1-like 5' DNA nuclease
MATIKNDLKIEGVVKFKQINATANANAGEQDTYIKSDGNMYKIDSLGNEVQIIDSESTINGGTF